LPGYLKSLPETNYVDFISPYGYSGPILSNDADDQFIEKAWSVTTDYFKSAFVVSCFIRFALDANTLGFPGEVKSTMKNIKGRILPVEDQWKGADRKVKKNYKKSMREGLTYKIVKGLDLSEDDLAEFNSIYFDTMIRNNAHDNYFYSKDDFLNYTRNCGELCLFIFIYDEGKPVSVEMVLISDESIFSFLGGTLSKAFDKRPNDLLKVELINWARANNITYFVLGGGYGAEDGIFKYKKTFFTNDVVDYFTGRWIVSPEKYSQILFKAKTNFKNLKGIIDEELESKDYFPEYRKYMNN